MATQHPPFHRAELSDKYYSKIVDGKFKELFEDDNLSEDLMDLFERMFSLDPYDRYTLEEIKEHSWYNGPVASYEDIVSDFQQRMELQEQNKHRAGKSHSNVVQKPDLNSHHAVHEKHAKKFTPFFDVRDGEELVDVMVNFAKDSKIGYEKSKDFFRVFLIINNFGVETKIIGNVLKKAHGDER